VARDRPAGPRLAAPGFVVFGIETNNLNDSLVSRGTAPWAQVIWSGRL